MILPSVSTVRLGTRRPLRAVNKVFRSSLSSVTGGTGSHDDYCLSSILRQVQNGHLDAVDAEAAIRKAAAAITSSNSSSSQSQEVTSPPSRLETPEEILQSFANLDHTRSSRTSFPEAVFGTGKTPDQIARILDDMARHYNETVAARSSGSPSESLSCAGIPQAILATRVTPEMYQHVSQMPFHHGHLEYHEMARIISMIPSSSSSSSSSGQQKKQTSLPKQALGAGLSSRRRVVVATAGTTDLYVAEEAAVTLEAANVSVDRIYDVGVAGLHRVIKALPRLQDPTVGCVVVCAGMDGALPSVVGGLVKCPVIAVPTSIGYGVSLGGIAALLTMLNSCSPGVGVVNVDNGFGAAALAYKCILGKIK